MNSAGVINFLWGNYSLTVYGVLTIIEIRIFFCFDGTITESVWRLLRRMLKKQPNSKARTKRVTPVTGKQTSRNVLPHQYEHVRYCRATNSFTSCRPPAAPCGMLKHCTWSPWVPSARVVRKPTWTILIRATSGGHLAFDV